MLTTMLAPAPTYFAMASPLFLLKEKLKISTKHMTLSPSFYQRKQSFLNPHSCFNGGCNAKHLAIHVFNRVCHAINGACNAKHWAPKIIN